MSDTMEQAQHIWSMLDDMAAQDPDSYKKFIEKNLNEGKEALRPPQPHMCVRTTIHRVTPSGRQSEKLYINIMDWPRVPAPKSDTDAIPTASGGFYPSKDSKGDDCKLAAVAFNTAVLKDFGIDSNKPDEMQQMILLAIQYLHDLFKVDISTTYFVLPVNQRCMGPVQEAIQSLTKKFPAASQNGVDSQFESELTELERTFGPMASVCKDSILSKLATLSNDEERAAETSDIKLPGFAGKKSANNTLIVEISSTKASLQTPHHTVARIESPDGARILVEVQLPGVQRIGDCNLDISEDDIYLIVEDKYELTLSLPSRIVTDCAAAKFSKRSSCLTLTLPVLSEL